MAPFRAPSWFHYPELSRWAATVSVHHLHGKVKKKDLKHLGVLTISARNSGCIPYAHTLFVVACYSHDYSHHSLSSTE